MYNWYRVPKEITDEGIIPKYSDSLGCKGFSGTVINEKYVVRLYGEQNFHEELINQSDVVALSDREVSDVLNSKFNKKENINYWNDKFKLGS